MKKKLSLTLISILSVVVLVGVGFAAWIITTPSVEETQTGTITASGVTDARYKLTATIADGDIVFGKPSTMDKKNAWLINDDAKPQHLTATLTLSLTTPNDEGLDETVFSNYLPANFILDIKTLKGNDDDTTFAELVANGYIAYPTVKIRGEESDLTNNSGGGFGTFTIPKAKFSTNNHTVTLEITFAWGTKFGGQNPYDFYNADGKTVEKDGAEAKAALEEIKKLDKISYRVTVKSEDTASA